jgi:hypothetical protein
MEDVAPNAARGFRSGAEDMVSRRGPGAAAYGGMAGAMMGAGQGSNENFQEDDLTESGMGALGGAAGGAGAGVAASALMGGGRGGGRALRQALQRIIEDGGQRRSFEGAPERRPMEMMDRLRQLQRVRDSLPDDDPRRAQIEMAISQLEEALSGAE